MIEVFNNEPISTDEELSDAGATSASDASPIPGGFHMDYSFFSSGLTQVQPGEFSDTLADAFIDYGIQFDPSCSGPNSGPSDDGIAGILASILSELDCLHKSLGTNNQMGSGEYHFDMASARGVLTPENMRRNISTYFQTANVHHALIHRATFSIEHAQPALVLSMFLSGSVYRRKKDQYCRDLFDIAEEYAFAQLNRAMMANSTNDPAAAKDLDSSLQAATLMHGLQWVVNSASSRKRNLALRLPQLVSAIRELGYTRLRHSALDPGAALRWKDFITLESRIRIGSLVVQSDWHQAGIYHTPCLTTIYEMTGDLPCPCSLWEAKDADEFHSIILAKGVDILHRTFSIRSCVEDLMKDGLSAAHLSPLRKLTMADLSLVMDAFLVVVDSARLSCTLPALAPKAFRAISRWRYLWDIAIVKADKEESAGRVMVKHGTEMCWLAKKLVEVSVNGKEDAAYFQGVAHKSLVEVHGLVRDLGS